MNKIILMGRLTKEPDVRYTQTGKVVTSLTLAVDRQFKGQDGEKETDFISVVIWGKAAEMVGNSCQKGHRLLVDGRLQIRSYEAKDGTKRWAAEVVANSVEFIERKSENATPAAESETGTKSGMEAFGTAVPFDEDIPF